MSTTTPNLTLTLYDSTTDQSVTFATFRAVWGGTATTSNFYRIDTWAGTVNSSITTLQNQRGAITVSASYISANYYEATVSSISSYISGMTILLKLDTDSAGTVTLNINSLGTKSVTKVNSSGTIVNITGGELQSNRYYMFTYDGTQWVWVNANSADQVFHGGTSGNIVLVSSDGSISDSSTPATVVGSSIYTATAKTTLADADTIGITDSAASNILKKITWANFKTAIGTGIGGIINALTAKTTPVGADTIAIGDSASSYASKQVLLSNLYKSLGTGTQDSTTYLRGDGTYATVTSGAASNGWVTLSGVTFTYSSADSPTFVISANADMTSTLSVGMKMWFQNNSTDVFCIITAIGSWSGSAQLITIYCGTDYTVANSAITSPYYSTSKAPKGFPINPDKWTVTVTDTTTRTQASPTADTWYNIGTTNSQISLPIGSWRVSYKVAPYFSKSSTIVVVAFATLSTANNSESDAEMTGYCYSQGSSANMVVASTIFISKLISVSSKTTYYLNAKSTQTGGTTLGFDNASAKMFLRAESAYL